MSDIYTDYPMFYWRTLLLKVTFQE